MRKREEIYFTVILIVLLIPVLLVSGCSNDKASTTISNGKIVPVELSQDEKQLLNAVGVKNYFVFQVNWSKGERKGVAIIGWTYLTG